MSYFTYTHLGGGFKHVLSSPRTLGKMNPIWRAYFSGGLVQPPTSYKWGILGLEPTDPNHWA